MLNLWKSEEGQKQLKIIVELLKLSEDKSDFQNRFLNLAGKPPFENLNWEALRIRFTRESLYGGKTEASRLWEKLPKGSKIVLGADWSEEKKESFKKDWSGNMSIAQIRENYKNPTTGKIYEDYQLSKIGKRLGLSRVLKGGASTQGGNVNKENPNEELTPEQRLISQREASEITVEVFLKGLAEIKSELAEYWEVIYTLIAEKRKFRNTEFLPFALEKGLKIHGKTREHKLNFTRGFLDKFLKWNALSSFDVKLGKKESYTFYLCDLPDFYRPKELFNLIPEKDLKLITDLMSTSNQKFNELTERLSRVIGPNLLETILDYYVELGLVIFHSKSSSYSVSERGQEKGIDAQSVKTVEAEALENAVFVKEEETGTLLKNFEEVGIALKRDIDKKSVPVTDWSNELAGKDLKLLFIGEVMYGSQYTDQKLLDWILDSVNEPTLVFTSGLVQGRFEIRNKAKTKMLAEESGLHKIESQFHVSGMLLEWLEKIATSKICVIQGDDDFRLAEDYGTLMHLAEGKNPWKFGVNWSSFSGEMKRRLENRELRRKIKIQWEIIQTYMYRIGRSLFNKKEVEAVIGVHKSEYRLIIEIMVAKRNNFVYPKEYEKVVNIAALYGNIGKRIVSPDPLRIRVAEGKEIRLVHNAGFSDITMYQKTIQHLDAIARHIGLSRREMPWILADFHQESFFAEYLMGTWIMNMPGMQNTLPAATYTLTEWHTKILEAKERRQSRVRKEPPSSAGVEMHCLADGRIRFRILNNSVRKVLEEQKGEEEKCEIAVIGTDLQFGSITMWPELTAKFLDYGLYAKRATRCYLNGDIIHGSIYPQHNAESRDLRLTSLHAQQIFGFNLIMPLFLDAPALVDLAAWLGNHEWNNMSAKYQGDSPLTFLETGLKGVLMERKRVGTVSSLERVMTVSRIRWMDTHNPQGDIVNWPFFADTICGFKVAIQHMWQPFGGEDTASDAKNWLKRMAKAARSIDILIGGHKHSVYMAQIADKWAVSAGAAAGQSGYELARGLMSTVMFTLVEFSNRTGITVEFVPWEFLMNYKFQGPAYKDKDDLFVRPAESTEDYKRGKVSPFINNMIDDLTHYFKV